MQLELFLRIQTALGKHAKWPMIAFLPPFGIAGLLFIVTSVSLSAAGLSVAVTCSLLLVLLSATKATHTLEHGIWKPGGIKKKKS